MDHCPVNSTAWFADMPAVIEAALTCQIVHLRISKNNIIRSDADILQTQCTESGCVRQITAATGKENNLAGCMAASSDSLADRTDRHDRIVHQPVEER